MEPGVNGTATNSKWPSSPERALAGASPASANPSSALASGVLASSRTVPLIVTNAERGGACAVRREAQTATAPSDKSDRVVRMISSLQAGVYNQHVLLGAWPCQAAQAELHRFWLSTPA